MKIALLMDHNSYSGREYLKNLKKIKIDVITFGNNSEFDKMEYERCSTYWRPPKIEEFNSFFKFYNFNSLNDKHFLKHLKNNNYDLGIQGGTGILKMNVISLFSIGIVNFHPGDLPFYRGCSAPEWQLFEDKDIICTAHLIDAGIDSGPIIIKKKLSVNMNSYYSFRASIYPRISEFLSELINKALEDKSIFENLENQNEKQAIYRKYIGDEIISKLKERLDEKI